MAETPWYKKAYYSLPGNQGSGEDAWRNTKKAGGGGGGGGWGNPNPPAPTPDNSVSDAALNQLRAQNLQLQQQIAATPKLARFDVMGNWNAAKTAAEKAVNPRYDRMLSEFLANAAARKQNRLAVGELTRQQIGQQLTQSLEDSLTQRNRTTEDTAAAIDTINKNEGFYQTDEGQDFDTNYRQVAEQLAATGGATTGMGRQATADMVRLRNVTSQRQLDEFKGQRDAKELMKTRTFEDLARGDERARLSAENAKKAEQFDLEAYLEDMAYEEKVKRDSIETERLGSVLDQAQQYEKVGVEQFLAGLAGQGYKASDIAYNRSVYA